MERDPILDARTAYAVLGASAALVAVVVVPVVLVMAMSVLYEVGADATRTNTFYAVIGGIGMSPVAMVVGGACASVLRDRPFGKARFWGYTALGAAVALAMAFPFSFPMSFAGDFSVRHAITTLSGAALLGALGAATAIGFYGMARALPAWQFVLRRVS